MRRLLFCTLLLLVASIASAQPREALITPDGTLFTIDAVSADDAADIAADVYLVLHARHGGETHEEIIPATTEKGWNSDPALAYDAASRTLFVFWLRHQGLLYNELVVASRASDGTWGPATTFDFTQPFNSRQNLRIAVTRRVSNPDGTLAPAPALSVHVVWWELDSTTGIAAARYAMLPIEDGRVASVDQLSLSEFAVESNEANDDSTESGEEIDRAVLRQPLLFSSSRQDSVLLLFGDYGTGQLHEVRIRPTLPPVADGRLRVPVGRTERGHGAPRFEVGANSRLEGIYNDSERLAFFTRDAEKLRYVLMKNGEWTESRTIALDAQITSDAAVEALRRLVTEN